MRPQSRSCRSTFAVLTALTLAITMLGGSLSDRSAAAHGVYTGPQSRLTQASNDWTVTLEPEQPIIAIDDGEWVHVSVTPPAQNPPAFSIWIRVKGPSKTYEVECGFGVYVGSQERQCNASFYISGTRPLWASNLKVLPPQTVTVEAVVREGRCGRELQRSDPVQITWVARNKVPNSPKVTQAMRDAYKKSANRWDWGIWIVGSLGFCSEVISKAPPPACKPFWLGKWIAGGLVIPLGYMKRHYDQLAADPADAQFTVIATPVVHAPLQLPRGTGVSPPTRAALNAFLANAEQMMEITDALLTSLNRAQGAINARNAYWTQQQMQAAVQYAQRDATIISAEPMLLARLQHTLQAAGVHITVTLADIRKFQQHVVTQGLPPSMTQTFKQLGVDSATIGQIQGQFAVPDPLASPGRFPDMLTDPQLIAAINASADALRKFAAAASKRPSVPAAVANTIPARGVLRAGTTHLKAATKASAESLRQFAASAAAASCNAPKPPGTAVPTAQATAQQPTKLTLTVHGRTAWDSVTDGAVSHKDPALPVTLTVGTALTAQAVTDAPMPKGWLLHLYRTGERDPKTGGYLEICRSTTTTCSATRPGLTMTAEEAVSAQVTAPTYSALSAQLLVDWTKP